MSNLAFWIVCGFIVSAFGLAWLYFRRYQISRPPIGVFNLWDITTMVVFILIAPFLYLILPQWLVVGLLLLVASSILYSVLEPMLKRSWIAWLILLSLLSADVGASLLAGSESNPFLLINDLVLVIIIVGITNLWTQSGLKARDATILGLFLVIYDYMATSYFSLTGDLVRHLKGLPLAPLVGWNTSEGNFGIGLGDLLIAVVFPLVMYKAFGRKAGRITWLISSTVLVSVLLLPVKGEFPTMIGLGPVMFLQYLYWHKGRRERSVYQYFQGE